MSPPVEALEDALLKLPDAERAHLLELLLAGFDPAPAPGNAWIQLAQTRVNDVKSGTVTLASGHEALERVRARMA